MMANLSSILLVCAGVSSLILLSGYFAIYWHLRSIPPRTEPRLGITILKPLKGVDEGLLDNLRAIAQQQYPHFEVIFGAEDANDPALDVARQVMLEFPHQALRVVSGAFNGGLNPKVRVLRQLLPQAKHEWILISDSNVRPDPNYLRALCDMQQLHQADLVHSMLVGSEGSSLGGRLEELQLNGWVSASIALSDVCRHSCVIGKSMLLRRAALLEVGGFESVADILAEDYILGSKLERAHKRVVISPHLLPVMTGRCSTLQFFNRHVRWGQMRRRISPGFYLAELTANPTPFIIGWGLISPSHLIPWVAAAQFGKWACDAIVYLCLTPRPSYKTLSLMPLKDLLVPVMWAAGGLRRTVNWRGHRLRVGPGSRLFPAGGPAPAITHSTSWMPRPS
jgi:ceramide glucosyltransferase